MAETIVAPDVRQVLVISEAPLITFKINRIEADQPGEQPPVGRPNLLAHGTVATLVKPLLKPKKKPEKTQAGEVTAFFITYHFLCLRH